MSMQFRKGDLNGVIVVRAEAWLKRDKVAGANRLRIDHLNMASRGTVIRLGRDPEVPKAGWFCLRVTTGREKAVEKVLNASDVESLVVMTNECKVVKRGRVCIIPPRPVILGYVLVHCCPIAQAMMGLLHVKDVIDVVGGAIRPYRADADSISRFKKMAEDGKYDASARKEYKFELKERVRITEGPFASFPGIIGLIDDEKGYVSLDVDIFGRPTPVQLMLDQIEKM
ncbi:transcription termination/antitermination protein NusG [Rhizobium lentis]|uniref:Transcription termination/antitermination protein NusG n=1 Tax=Rhizobium lentis TaxID=1138194 RepID=A0A7W8UPM9_9HYPH|nr:transcription termination/antitermination NusG family protein [Rhizobium lentis]MBB4574405.1 transcriptional antiterminator NusG [Rhizobium lentis]MBB5550331.1 transcriptional antiterminator NusG [Rhizobium lentis]MBB5560640.1 transcriptional antiterminator NusG [Rhizobium lentis]MBB5567225.1 transcriptional antiterminator NusG [Rhizobium lentis]